MISSCEIFFISSTSALWIINAVTIYTDSIIKKVETNQILYHDLFLISLPYIYYII